MTRAARYQCQQCETTTTYRQKGARIRRACPDCGAVTSWDRLAFLTPPGGNADE